MTTIVYANHALYADRLHVCAAAISMRIDATKLTISADQQFAYGNSWIECPEPTKPAYEAELRRIVEWFIENPGDSFEPTSLSDIFGKDFKLTHPKHGLLMTRTEAYQISQDNGVSRITEIPTGIGSGGWIASGRIAAGLDPVQAIAGMGMLDYQTGKTVDTIKASKLKPFVYKGVKK